MVSESDFIFAVIAFKILEANTLKAITPAVLRVLCYVRRFLFDDCNSVLLSKMGALTTLQLILSLHGLKICLPNS